MNAFNQKLQESGNYPLKAKALNILEANVGYKCNLRCTHCYVEASPDRTEEMPLNIINKILDILRENNEITTLDITGGAPELNPHFKYFVKSAAELGKKVLVRSNLAVYTEPGTEELPEFLAGNKVKIIASLPCFSEEGVDRQRGKGTYKKVIPVLKKLNELGYGREGSPLELELVFNPDGASIAPDSKLIENAYREKLKDMHGITFNHLIALNNAPVGRLRKSVSEAEIRKFERDIEEKFNPDTVENVMCRYIINVSYDGKLYDCDCTQMADLPVTVVDSTIDNFDYEKLKSREIMSTTLCFGCTAGRGSSCMPDKEVNSECAVSAVSASSGESCPSGASTAVEQCNSDITRPVNYDEVTDQRVKQIFDELIKGFHKVLPVYRVKNFVNDPAWMETYHKQIMYKFTPRYLDYKTLMLIEFAADIAARWEYCIGGAYDKCLEAAGITPEQINKTIKLVSACGGLSYLETGFDVFSQEEKDKSDFRRLIDPDKVADEAVRKMFEEVKKIFGKVPEVYRVQCLVDDREWMQVFHKSLMLYFRDDVLDLKTLHLICIGALTVLQSNSGVTRHIDLAQRAGAAPEEIAETIRGIYVNAYVFNTSAGFGIFKYTK